MAQPILNNVINQGNLDQPINQIVPEGEEEEPESLFMQLTSQLSLSELLAIF